jgi:hypothetical protein
VEMQSVWNTSEDKRKSVFSIRCEDSHTSLQFTNRSQGDWFWKEERWQSIFIPESMNQVKCTEKKVRESNHDWCNSGSTWGQPVSLAHLQRNYCDYQLSRRHADWRDPRVLFEAVKHTASDKWLRGSQVAIWLNVFFAQKACSRRL